MLDDANKVKQQTQGNASDHLANERTFLAWIRTSIGIMAFGFVVVKFALFVKQLALLLKRPLEEPPKGYSALIGIFLVAFGAITAVFALLRYRETNKQIKQQAYQTSPLLSIVLAAVIFLIGLGLVAYLVFST